MSGTTADNFVADINGNASLVNVSATKLSTGAIQITHALGGEIRLNDGATLADPDNTNGTPLADAGFGTSTAHTYGGFDSTDPDLVANLYAAPAGDSESEDSTTPNELIATNWKRLSYTASVSAPTNEPADGTLWYDTNTDVADIMIHNGTTWVSYLDSTSPFYSATASEQTDPNGPLFSATAPTKQSDGTNLKNGDLWIDTSDLENYPKLYKYNTSATLSSSNTANQVAVTTIGAAWELVDKADQTTENGIVFADARWHTSTDKAAGRNTINYQEPIE
jgi:hypothetical protein